MTAALPLRWNSEPLVDRPGRRRSVGRLEAHEEPGGSRRLRQVGDDVAAVKSKVKALAPGYPSYGPAATRLAGEPEQGPVLRRSRKARHEGSAPISSGRAGAWSRIRTSPSGRTRVVTQLVAGKSLSSLLPALGDGLAQNAQAAGYKVVRQRR